MVSDQTITELVQKAINDRVFPGAQVGYIKEGRTKVISLGHLRYESSPAVTPDTLYDVASITKSIPLATLVLMLMERGRVALDDQIIAYVPEIACAEREQILVRHLLTYTVIWDLPGGLAAAAGHGAEALWQAIWQAPLMAPPGQKYHYTNTPAIILGLMVERLTGQSLDELAGAWLFEPLGMTHSTFWPERVAQTEVAPTELTATGEVCGRVHDEAAWTLRQAGQVAGDAGLFTTAGDLLRFAHMILDGGQGYLSGSTIERLSTNHIARLGDSAGLGWELGQERFMGTKGSARLFGKTGFTGSYILIDPVSQAAVVLLSNRTYPHRPASRDAINGVRRALAELILA